MDIATLGCSVNAKLSDGQENIYKYSYRIWSCGAGSHGVRYMQKRPERGLEVTEESIEKIGDTVLEDVTPSRQLESK